MIHEAELAVGLFVLGRLRVLLFGLIPSHLLRGEELATEFVEALPLGVEVPAGGQGAWPTRQRWRLCGRRAGLEGGQPEIRVCEAPA
jgi:hypothetical protein